MNKYCKIIKKYDLNKIKEEIETLPYFEKELCLQGINPDSDYNECLGKIENLKYPEDSFKYPLFDIPYINSILEENKIYRTRLLILKPHTCYSWHKDPTFRYHIPIITHRKCKFAFEDLVFHMPADGSLYEVDTRQKHTAFNGRNDEGNRLHLVGNI